MWWMHKLRAPCIWSAKPPGLTKRQLQLLLLSGLLLLLISIGCAQTSTLMIVSLLCIALLIGIVAMVQPPFALFLLAVGASLPSIVIPLPGHHMHLVEPAFILCMIVIIIRRPAIHLRLPHLLALTFLSIACISFLHMPELSKSTSPYGADKRLITVIIILGTFFCGTALATCIKNSAAFLNWILLGSLVPYLIALCQALKFPLSSWLEAPGAGNMKLTQGRLWGPFPWSVNFGMYLMNLFAIALTCWLCGQNTRQRRWGATMTLSTAIAILGTGTRSATIASLSMLFIALLATRSFKLLIISICGILVGMMAFIGQLLPLFTHDDTSTTNRLLIWSEALRLIRANPWIGIGLQQFPHYYTQLIIGRATELGPQGMHPHEQYLEWAMESGLPWLIIGSLLLGSIAICCLKAYLTTHDKSAGVLLAAFLATLGNIIVGFFDVPLDQLEGSVIFFLLAGLALGSLQLAPKGKVPWLSGWSKHRSPEPLNTPAQNHPPANDTVPARSGRAILLQCLAWASAIPLILPMTALLTRYLGPAQYGEYSLTFPFLTIFALLSGTGMDPLIVRQLSLQARERWGQILGEAVGIRAVWTSGSILLASFCAYFLPTGIEQRTLFLLGAGSLLFSFSFNGVRIVYTHGFRAEQRIGHLVLIETANRIITAGLIALGIWLHLALTWLYALLIYSDLPAFIILVLLAHRRYKIRIIIKQARWYAYLRASMALTGYNVLSLLAGQIDLLALTVLTGPTTTGLYALATRITDPLISIALAYVNGLYPSLCQAFEKRDGSFSTACHEAWRILLLCITPIAILITLAGSTIIMLLGGQNFSSATPVIQLLAWATVITFLNQVGERACIAAHLEKRIPLIMAISTTINLSANISFIALWGIRGAALASLLSEGVLLLLFLYLLRQHLRLKTLISSWLLILGGNIPAVFWLTWQNHLAAWLIYPPALLLTCACYIVTRQLTTQDIYYGKTLLDHKGGSNIQRPEKTSANTRWSITDYPTVLLPKIQTEEDHYAHRL